MKKSIVFFLFIVFGISYLSAQSKLNPAGTWKFAAPYAPEGYDSGTIIIGSVDKKDTATMSFTGNEYKIPCENLKIKKDSVLYSLYLEDQDVRIYLKIENDTSMTGKAVYSEGEVPLILTKAAEETKK